VNKNEFQSSKRKSLIELLESFEPIDEEVPVMEDPLPEDFELPDLDEGWEE
jgi:hypothetical protein